MDGIINWILDNDSSVIIGYLNFFFIAIAAVALIGLVVGLIRGTYKSVTYELGLFICVMIVVFCSSSITKALYGMDLSFIPGVADMIPGETKTIGAMIEEIVKVQLANRGITGDTTEFVNTVTVLSISVLNIIVYIMGLLISIIVLAPLIHLLLYHVLFKLIIPKKILKKHKIRLLGGALTALEGAITFCLFLSPFTAFANTLTGAMKDEKGNIVKKECTDEKYNAIIKALDAYNNSAVSKFFFTISLEKGKSFDVSLMDQVTQTPINGEKFELYSELGNIGSLFISALSTGAFENNFDAALLLIPEFVDGLFSYLGDSVLMQTMLSLGMVFITSSSVIPGNINLDGIDFNSVDWKDVTSALNTTYTALYDGGIIEDITNVEEGKNILDNICIDETNVSYYKTAFESLGNNDLVCKIMPKLICSYAKANETNKERISLKKNASNEEKDNFLKDFEFPKEEDFYSSIRWGSELSTLVDVFFEISQQYYAYYDNKLYFSKIGEAFSNEPMNFLLGKESVTSYTTLEEKYSSNVFIDGGKYKGKDVPGIKAIIVGTKVSEKYKGLFDLEIFKKIANETNNIQKLINSFDVKSLVSNMEIDSTKIEESMNEVKTLTASWRIAEWKEEFSGLVDTLLPILDIVDEIGNDVSIFTLGENIECTLNSFDNSQIIKTIIPPVFEGIIGDSLTIGDIKRTPDFSNIENWGEEGKYLHSLLDSINEISAGGAFASIDWANIDNITKEAYDAAVSNGYDGSFDDYYIDNSKIYKVLSTLYDTQCIGGKYKEDGLRENGIFDDLLKGILIDAIKSFDSNLDLDTCREAELIDLDFNLGNNNVVYSQDGTNKTYVSWKSDNPSYRGEIAHLALLIGEIKNISGDSMSSLNGALNRMNDSYILRDIMTLILKNKVDFSLEEGVAKEFMQRADLDAFHKKYLSLTPYEYVLENGKETIKLTSDSSFTTRKEEIEARKAEITSLIDIFECIDDVTSALDSYKEGDSFYPIKKLTANKSLTSSLPDGDEIKTSNEKSILERITTILEDSRIFNTPVYVNGNRKGTTSFEYLFQYITGGDTVDVSDFLINLESDPSIIYKITSNNLWDDEIVAFNNSLYNIVNNDLVTLLSSSTDLLSDINGLLESGKTPIQDLFMDMHESILLDYSIGYALDKNFIPKILDNIDVGEYEVRNQIYHTAKNYYENKDAISIKNTLNAFNAPSEIIDIVNEDKMKAFWKNEALSLEEIVKEIVNLDLNNMDVQSDANIDISNITGAFEHSLCLNYLDDESHIVTPSYNERSIYQLLIINLIDKVNAGIDAIGLDSSTAASSFISENRMYKEEAETLCEVIASFQKLNKFINGETIEINETNAEQISIIFGDFTRSLHRSNVYHYLKNSERIDNKLSVFEQIISKMITTANLDNSIYNPNNPKHAILGNSKAIIEDKIMTISNEEKLSDGDPSLKWVEEGAEIDRICSLIKIFNTIVFDSIANELSSYISKTSLGYEGLLPLVNSSYLLHDIVSTMIREFICKVNIDDIENDIGSPSYKGMLIKEGSKINYYQIDSRTDIDFAHKVNLWNDEMYMLISLIDIVKEIQNADNIINIMESNPFETVLSKLSKTVLFDGTVDQITISLMHDYATVSVSSYTCSLSKFLYGTMNKNLGYEDTIDYLLEKYGSLSYDWNKEGKGIDDFIRGLPTFVSAYSTYLVNKSLGSSPSYPVWENTIEGYLGQRMSNQTNLQYVFVE